MPGDHRLGQTGTTMHADDLISTTDGTRLRVIRRGPAPAEATGPLLVLVHGLASNARMWDGVGEALAAQGYRSAAVDLRGHGHSDKPDHGYDFDTICADLADVLDALGEQRAVIVGQSWGGNIVVHAAHALPDRVVGAVAVDGGMIELASVFPQWDDCAVKLRPPDLSGLSAARLEAGMRAMHADWPETGIAGSLANFEVLVDGTVRAWLTLPRHLLILRELWAHRPSAMYPHITRPVLLLPADSGDVAWAHDKHLAVEAALASLPHGRVVWFRPAHHDLHAQFPQRCADVIVEHIQNGFLV
jgi:pimeloyl-ACP methyl ester carboxylesterase